MKIFFANIHREAVESDLVGLFAEQGIELRNLKLCSDRETGKPKGFGFAEVSDDVKEKALELNDTPLFGRRLHVARARHGRNG